jgi:tRNA (guanine-N7-)-methyltransferase
MGKILTGPFLLLKCGEGRSTGKGGNIVRLRNKPWAKDMIENHPHIVIPISHENRGNWSNVFQNDHPIHIEIGTGRGQFVCGMAAKHPKINFVGIEKYQSVVIDVIEKVVEENLPNLKLLNIDANTLLDIFEDNEVARIYLNFSDPWPKNRHEKRRLTFEGFLNKYEKILVPNGEVHFKTDNQGLFEYSLESFSRFGMEIKNISLDLHQSDIEGNVMTEYEEKFSKKGQRIFRCEAKFR